MKRVILFMLIFLVSLAWGCSKSGETNQQATNTETNRKQVNLLLPMEVLMVGSW